MAGGYGRFDDKEASGGTLFVMGLVAGTLLGVGLGMLFAPKSGAALRRQLRRQAGALADQAQDGYRNATDNVGQWVAKGTDAAAELSDRGKEMYGKAREAVEHGADEAQKYVRDAADAVSDATSKLRRS
jgi:gas vesicle protein